MKSMTLLFLALASTANAAPIHSSFGITYDCGSINSPVNPNDWSLDIMYGNGPNLFGDAIVARGNYKTQLIGDELVISDPAIENSGITLGLLTQIPSECMNDTSTASPDLIPDRELVVTSSAAPLAGSCTPNGIRNQWVRKILVTTVFSTLASKTAYTFDSTFDESDSDFPAKAYDSLQACQTAPVAQCFLTNTPCE